jgi:hypothetical protein
VDHRHFGYGKTRWFRYERKRENIKTKKIIIMTTTTTTISCKETKKVAVDLKAQARSSRHGTTVHDVQRGKQQQQQQQ